MKDCKDFCSHSHSRNNNSNNKMQAELNVLHAANLGI